MTSIEVAETTAAVVREQAARAALRDRGLEAVIDLDAIESTPDNGRARNGGT